MLLSRETGVPFLDLPCTIRRRIYHFAGLTRSYPIELVGTPSCPAQRKVQGTLSTSLFLVSRYISFESLREFFKENRFMVVGNQPTDLDAVRRIPGPCLVKIGSIRLYLNPQRSNEAHDNEICSLYDNHGRLSSIDDIPAQKALGNITSADCGMIWALDRLGGYLGGISYQAVQLTCFCNPESPEIAARINRSIRRLAPKAWHEYEVRLDNPSSSSPRSPTEPSFGGSRQSHFPFFKLPAEIRFAILCYTDLHPEIGSDEYSEGLFVANGRLRTSYWNFSGLTRSFRTIPFPLFLVSKQMKKEAEYVLFSLNCLNFTGGVLEAYDYLVRSPKERLQAIRHLQLCFPPIDSEKWESETGSRWHLLLGFIRSNLNTQALCLFINISDHSWSGTWQVDKGYTPFEYEEICRLALCLPGLGLHDLHFTLPQGNTLLETLLEQEVMGPDHDSSRGNRKARNVLPTRLRQIRGRGHGQGRGQGQGIGYHDRGQRCSNDTEVRAQHATAWKAAIRCYNHLAHEEYEAERVGAER